MTDQNKNTNQKNTTRPTHSVYKKVGYGKQVNFETIGVAWDRENGGLYIKLHGTQIVDGGFYVSPVKQSSSDEQE